MTDPEYRRDPWKEALNCYSDISEEVVTVGQSWEKEFKWSKIGKVFQEGFAESKGNWVLHLAVDMFIHQDDIKKVYDCINKNPDIPALTLPKYKFFEPGRYEIKSFETVLLNKKKFVKNTKQTLGINFETVEYKNEDVMYKLYIWDTSGHPRFERILNLYIRNTKIFFLNL